MSIRRPDYDELIERHDAEHRRATSDTFRDLAKTSLQMVGCVLAGWVFIGFSVHTTNEVVGRILWWTGLAVWIPGVLYALLAAYRRGELRGDW